jgi:GNAT superfamily N-acetyltransferase
MAFTIHPRPFDHPDSAALLELVQQYYVHLYGGRDEDATDLEQFTPPNGLFLVGYLDGEPVACGGWRRRSPDAVEIKRMYVVDQVRRGGLARAMLEELERTASAAGATQVVLNTGFRQKDAMRFYEVNGYRPTDDRFGHYEAIDGAIFYSKAL